MLWGFVSRVAGIVNISRSALAAQLGVSTAVVKGIAVTAATTAFVATAV